MGSSPSKRVYHRLELEIVCDVITVCQWCKKCPEAPCKKVMVCHYVNGIENKQFFIICQSCLLGFRLDVKDNNRRVDEQIVQ
jgi:hypothetical protein